MSYQEHARRYASFFEQLSSVTTEDDYLHVMAQNIHFEDPFNDVYGVENVQKIMDEMFVNLNTPSFKVNDVLTREHVGYLHWTFSFQYKNREQQYVFDGMSRIEMDETGRVVLHRDYWDASTHFYAQLPLMGTLIRWIKRKMSV